MNLMVDISFITTSLSVLLSFIAIWRVIEAGRKTEREKGIMQRDYEQAKKDIEQNREAIVILQAISQAGKVSLGRMEGQLNYLVKGMDDLTAKLDRHLERDT